MFSFFSYFKLIILKKRSSLKLIRLLLGKLVIFYLVSTNLSALESNNLEGTSLNLFGIAVHNELRNDIYIGAMFAPSEVNDSSQLYDESITKNMSLRFIQSYSNRKIARMWKQRIAMNNEKPHWQPLTKDIVSFAKIFKQPLKKGDEVNLVYLPNKGTKIYLNGSFFLLISNPEFYTILLNIWYGNVPPSKLFKNGITGNNTDYLQQKIISQYESLIPIRGRFDNDRPKTVQVNNKKPNSKQEKPKATGNKRTRKVVSSIPEADSTQRLIDGFKPDLEQTVTLKDKNIETVDKSAMFKVDLKLSDSNIDKPALTPVDLTIQTESNQAFDDELEDTQEITQPEISNESLVDNNSNAIITNDVELNPTDSDDIELEVIDSTNSIDIDLISGAYSKELVDLIKKNQKYPKKAIQKGHEGDLIISMTLNLVGEIDDLRILERSGSRYLDLGVLRQVKELAPFPAIPDSLKQESFTVKIPMSFAFSE